MTNAEILAARKLCEEASAGQWSPLCIEKQIYPGRYALYASGPKPVFVDDPWWWPEERFDQIKKDADFIAASRTLVPALLDEVETHNQLRHEFKMLQSSATRLSAENKELEKELQSARTRISISELEKAQAVVDYLTKERNPNIYMAIDLAMQAKGWLKDLEQGKQMKCSKCGAWWFPWRPCCGEEK